MLIRNYILLVLSIVLSFNVSAQSACAMAEGRQFSLEEIHKRIENEKKLKRQETLIVPVVFHVLHNYGPERISPNQVHTLLETINDDFNGRYANAQDVFTEFQDILGDAKVEFRLAKQDLEGGCTNGINFIEVSEPYFSKFADGRVRIEQLKREHHWDVTKYLNIYTVGSIEGNANNGMLGYTYFPRSNPQDVDGLVLRYDEIGNESKLTSHQLGHYLGLANTYGIGPEACNDSVGDGIDDTPVSNRTYVKSCPSKANAYSCGSLDNAHNLMSESSCRVNFTVGQTDFMRSVLLTLRANLVSASNIASTGVDYDTADEPTNLCYAYFDAKVGLSECPGSEVVFFENTAHSATTFSWQFEGGTPAISSERNPAVVYSSAGTFDVSLTVSDGDTAITVLKEDYVVIQDNSILGELYGEGFEDIDLATTERLYIENPDDDITFEVSDAAGFFSVKSISLRNVDVRGEALDYVTTNTMDLSDVDDAVLSFDYAFAKQRETNTDELEVLLSADCGTTWTRRKLFRADASPGSASSLVTAPALDASSFVPMEDEWKNYSVGISSSYRTEGFKARLSWTSGGGNNIYIDNLFIGSASAVGVSESTKNSLVKLFPNPNNGELNIVSEGGLISNVEVVNVYGAVVFNEAFSSEKANIQLGEVPTGVYFARVTNANGIISNLKFMVNTMY